MSETSERSGGVLFVVATPIGNLEDITMRAIRVLRESELILAEDTRRTRGLCEKFEIRVPLRAFHAHSNEHEVTRTIEALRQGARIALVSDAGTPVVSDPGAALVDAALEAGVRVESIPGASAVTTAIAASGLSSGTFRFVGFLPRSGQARGDALRGIVGDPLPSVFFEAPGRLRETLGELADVLGARRVAVCRELTKLHEEIARGTATELLNHFHEDPLGEITAVVEGLKIASEGASPNDIDATLRDLLSKGHSPKDAAAHAAAMLGVSKKETYQRVIRLRKQSE